MISIVIPTLQKDRKCLINLIKTALLDSAAGEIIVINNSLKGLDMAEFNNDERVKIITPEGGNIYVNPAWNLGVKEAKYDIVALVNDDLALPEGFVSAVEKQMTPDMGIVGLNSDKYMKVMDKIDENPPVENVILKKTNYMDLTYGACMFFYKKAYKEIPDEIKIVYGDAWIFYQAIKMGRKNYKISGQTVYHLGSLSSGDKVFNPVCKNDAKIYKRLMVKWYNRLLSYEETWFGYKFRILGLTFMFPKKVLRKIFGENTFGAEE